MSHLWIGLLFLEYYVTQLFAKVLRGEAICHECAQVLQYDEEMCVWYMEGVCEKNLEWWYVVNYNGLCGGWGDASSLVTLDWL